MSGNSRASRGEPIENPPIGHEFRLLGDRFRVLESARQTADGSLRTDYFAAPRANVPEHVHHPWEDCFEVLSGRLGVRGWTGTDAGSGPERGSTAGSLPRLVEPQR
jgi:hypothetical protein